MDFKILDASAFYAGVPFRSSNNFYTTSLVYDEIKHIKKDHDVIGILLDTNRLKIREPDRQSIIKAEYAAEKTGDLPQLSKQDISVLALSIELNSEIISDDFSISNVAKNLGLKISPIMTLGIRDVGKWIHYCPGCKARYDKGKKCLICGTSLKRKLLKRESLSKS